MSITTVGDLIDRLAGFDRDQPIRIMDYPGVMAGVEKVTEIHGRVVVSTKLDLRLRPGRFSYHKRRRGVA